jgi:S1-C subfamily serine protease
MTDDRPPFPAESGPTPPGQSGDPASWPDTPPPWHQPPAAPWSWDQAPTPPSTPATPPPPVVPPINQWGQQAQTGQPGQFWWAAAPGTAPGAPTPPPITAPVAAHPHSRRRNVLAFVGGLTVASLLIGAGALVRQGFEDTHHASQASSPITAPPTTSAGSGSNGSNGSGSDNFGGGSNSSGSGSSTPATTPQSSAAAQAIADKVNPAVVDIDTKLGYQEAAAAGTGMVLTSNGEILTNNHVVDGATSITATVVSTGKTFTAKVIGTDATDDVAVLQLQGASGLSTVNTADSSKVATGDQVVAIGNAGGTGGTPSVVSGTVTNINQSITASDEGGSNAEQLSGLIQTNAPIVAGDSGGPLANTDGQVIGMDTAASSQNQFASSSSVGFAIPINHALSIAKQIVAGQSSAKIHIGETAFLGVELAPDASSSSGTGAAGGYGYGSGSGSASGTGSGSGTGSTSTGVAIQGVVSGSPAAQAGLAAGDTIVSFGGKTVDSQKTLSSLTQAHHPGDRVSVTWTDASGATQSATVTLVVGPTG